eukprot:1332844-Rhodomonas_salina.1
MLEGKKLSACSWARAGLAVAGVGILWLAYSSCHSAGVGVLSRQELVASVKLGLQMAMAGSA